MHNKCKNKHSSNALLNLTNNAKTIWINNQHLTVKFYKIPFFGSKVKIYKVSCLYIGDKNIKQTLTSWRRVLLQKLKI